MALASDPGGRHAAFVLTVSDRVAAGQATDETGPALVERLEALGFSATLDVVPDDEEAIRQAVEGARPERHLVITNGGTGLSPRDVTPQALREILEYEVPGFGEAMRGDGRASTPHAILSRSLAGVYRGRLVIALPGSPRAALESLAAIESVLEHALATLSGEADRHPPRDADRHPPQDDAPG